jgi:outer membrane protein TolC
VEIAVKNHPDFVSAREALVQVTADKNITQSSLLPEIDADYSSKRTQSTTGKPSNTHSVSVSGTQLVFDGLKVINDVAGATEKIRATTYNYAVVSSDIRLTLRNAFVELLTIQNLVALTEEIAARRKQNMELVQMRYEAGREHRGSLLTAQADYSKAEYESIQARRNIALAQRRLHSAMGFSEPKEYVAVGKFTLIEDSRARPDYDEIADKTPFLKELISKKESARFNVNSAQADYFPEVYLSSSAGKSSNEWPPEDNQWSLGVSVSLPVFEGGKRRAQVTKARSQLVQAEAEAVSGRNSILVTLQETWTALQDAIDTVSIQQKYLEAAQERAKIASAQYSTGLINFDDWIIIEDNLASAQKSYLNAQANMLKTEAFWIQAKGGTLDYE